MKCFFFHFQCHRRNLNALEYIDFVRPNFIDYVNTFRIMIPAGAINSGWRFKSWDMADQGIYFSLEIISM